MCDLALRWVPAILLTLATPALGNDSVYSKLALEDCTIIDEYDGEEGGGSVAFICHGHDAIPLHVSEGDLRFSVVPLPKGYRGPIRFETLPAFNTLGETVEWRRNDKGEVIAIIQRWFTDTGDGKQGQVLVVTRVGADAVCHVAHIDALARAAANDTAREIADTRASAFRCGTDDILQR